MTEVMNCTHMRFFRHSSLEKTSNSGHSESSVFKQPPPIEPPRSSPSPTHRDPPWPHGGPSPSRPSSSERPQSQKGEATSASSISGHPRGPRAYKIPSKSQLRLGKKIHNVPWRCCLMYCDPCTASAKWNDGKKRLFHRKMWPWQALWCDGPREKESVYSTSDLQCEFHRLTFICYLCEWRAYYSCLM